MVVVVSCFCWLHLVNDGTAISESSQRVLNSVGTSIWTESGPYRETTTQLTSCSAEERLRNLKACFIRQKWVTGNIWLLFLYVPHTEKFPYNFHSYISNIGSFSSTMKWLHVAFLCHLFDYAVLNFYTHLSLQWDLNHSSHQSCRTSHSLWWNRVLWSRLSDCKCRASATSFGG